MSNNHLGLDLSLSSSGVCIIRDDGTIKSITSIKTKRVDDSIKGRWKRYRDIVTGIAGELRCSTFDTITIENYSLFGKGRIVQLVESATLVRNHILTTELNAHVIELPPMSLKKFALGDIKLDKNILCREAFKQFKVNIDNDDEVDAFYLAHFGRCYWLNKNKEKSKYKSYQNESAKKYLSKEGKNAFTG